MITRMKSVSIPVKDYNRALKFYTENLGFKLFTDHLFKDGSRWIELKIGSAQTKVILFTTPGQEDRVGTFSNITFTCEDVKKTYEELKKRGVEFTQSPVEAPWGIYAQFLDSEGNKFVLSSNR